MKIDSSASGSRWSWDLPMVAAAFVATTTAIAVPYWSASFDSIRDDGIFGSWLMVAVLLVAGTFLAGAVSEVFLGFVGVAMLTCVPIAVMGRVVMDVTAQPDAHDLWPLEVVLAGMMSVPFVGIGVALAWVVRRLSPRGASVRCLRETPDR